jgi:hypothetical protein
MSLQDRILNLACHWQVSNFDINCEFFEVHPFPLPTSSSPSLQKCSSPPSRLPRLPQSLSLELEIVEETGETVEEIALTPVYQRGRRSIGTHKAVPKTRANIGDPKYSSLQGVTLAGE